MSLLCRGANMAVDEKDSTYWASKFDAEMPQSFMLDFGAKKKMQTAVTPTKFMHKMKSCRDLSTCGCILVTYGLGRYT